MDYGSEDGSHINCAKLQIWSGYSDMRSLVKSVAEDNVIWPTLFQNTLARALAVRRRFAGPRVDGGGDLANRRRGPLRDWRCGLG